ncbi:MAG: hypothetical protein IPL61_13345 [Myxococcales bacterium]|nr:hypothetical protein [Myxococcales bacterium]
MERWLRDPARRQALERAFAAHLDTPAAATLAGAVDQWAWMVAGTG